MSWQAQYLAPGMERSTYHPTRDNWGPIVIPKDQYFVLGDNREESLDSRYWGLVDVTRIEGRAAFIYFSYDHDSYRRFPYLRTIRWVRMGTAFD